MHTDGIVFFVVVVLVSLCSVFFFMCVRERREGRRRLEMRVYVCLYV